MPGKILNAKTARKSTHAKLPNIHPGKILLEDFLLPLEISQYRLAKEIQVPARRINEIIHGTRALTADTALRLGLFFENDPRFWLNLQAHFDLHQEWSRSGKRLTREIRSARQFT